MRHWSQLSNAERDLFKRIFHEIADATVEEAWELKRFEVDMLCRPLEPKEIERANHILDSIETGFLSRSAA